MTDQAAGTEASLYLHIPFCSSRCGYCAFFSADDAADALDSYLNRMTAELHSLEFFPETIYIGGGDPGMLSPKQLNRLMEALSPLAGRCRELTMESNPEGVSREQLDVFASHGGSRISIGIQSFSPEARRVLGRRGSIEAAESALRLLDSYPGLRISADLITAVPGTHPGDTCRDIDRLLDLSGCGHISLYELDIEEQTALARSFTVPDEQDHLTPAWKHLDAKGFRQYELSNFCREGKQGLHNSRYWELKDCIGLGCSAVSSVMQADQLFRRTGPLNIALYCREGTEAGAYETVSLQEVLKELIMVSLRTETGIPVDRISRGWGGETAGIIEQGIRRWSDRGYMESGRMKRPGLLIMNTIILDFFDLVDSLGDLRIFQPLDTVF